MLVRLQKTENMKIYIYIHEISERSMLVCLKGEKDCTIANYTWLLEQVDHLYILPVFEWLHA